MNTEAKKIVAKVMTLSVGTGILIGVLTKYCLIPGSFFHVNMWNSTLLMVLVVLLSLKIGSTIGDIGTGSFSACLIALSFGLVSIPAIFIVLGLVSGLYTIGVLLGFILLVVVIPTYGIDWLVKKYSGK